MADKTAISVNNVSKSFKLPHEKHSGLKQAIIHFRPGKRYEMQHVLKDISFDIKEGEFFGIVGRNGSGKSTLLKLLAQIYIPDKGSIAINGSLTPFIELGVGFNPELTGRENVYLNGALLGFDRTEVSAMYQDIVDFAEIERFMDQKLKNYSSGMQVRLAFSIAIRAKSDILLIDEVLAVGDAAFQQKCFKYFEKLKQEKKTIVFVSHDMASVQQFCDKAVLVNHGQITHYGDPFDISREYDKLNFSNQEAPGEGESPDANQPKVSVYTHDGKLANNFEFGSQMVFEVAWPEIYDVHNVGFIISRGVETVFATNSFEQDKSLENRKARLRINPKLGNGRYRVVAGLFGKSHHDILDIGADQEFLIYNQPNKGSHSDEWNGATYIENHWL